MFSSIPQTNAGKPMTAQPLKNILPVDRSSLGKSVQFMSDPGELPPLAQQVPGILFVAAITIAILALL
jgi:hypothetical protein